MAKTPNPTFARFAEAPTVFLDVLREGEIMEVRRRRNAADVLFRVVGSRAAAGEEWSASRIGQDRDSFRRAAAAGEALTLSSRGVVCAVIEGVKP